MRHALPHRRLAAFTLLEVLLALGIFTLGFVAIAAIFPAAAILQKETVEDAVSQQFVRTAKALLQGRGLSAALDLDPNVATDYEVHVVPDTVLARWTLSDRSYPSINSVVNTRNYYWVPLVRRKVYTPPPHTPPALSTEKDDWQVFIFCLKREDNTSYGIKTTPVGSWANSTDPTDVPGVFKVSVTPSATNISRFDFTPATAGFNNADGNGDGRFDEIVSGDQVLDSNGTIYTVATADATGIVITGIIYPSLETGAPPNALWYGRPGVNGSSRTGSPTRRLIILTGAVK